MFESTGKPRALRLEGKAPKKGATAVQPKAEGESRGDLELNIAIQERVPESGARSSYYLLFWHLSEQPKDKVKNDGKHNTDYGAGHYREEELKAALVYEYIAGKLAQERNSLPEEQ